VSPPNGLFAARVPAGTAWFALREPDVIVRSRFDAAKLIPGWFFQNPVAQSAGYYIIVFNLEDGYFQINVYDPTNLLVNDECRFWR
jgi:hypothetical protein